MGLESGVGRRASSKPSRRRVWRAFVVPLKKSKEELTLGMQIAAAKSILVLQLKFGTGLPRNKTLFGGPTVQPSKMHFS